MQEHRIGIRQAAERVGRSVATLRRWERTGRVPGILRENVTGARRYSQADLAALDRLVALREASASPRRARRRSSPGVASRPTRSGTARASARRLGAEPNRAVSKQR